jgi:hypothetical protein
MDEYLWGSEEVPMETEFNRIRRVERKSAYPGDLKSVLEDLSPICRFDSGRSKVYRDRVLLRRVLRRAIPTVMIPEHERSF